MSASTAWVVPPLDLAPGALLVAVAPGVLG
jgi:hypothetical protein